jgi:hypothetical protein
MAQSNYTTDDLDNARKKIIKFIINNDSMLDDEKLIKYAQSLFKEYGKYSYQSFIIKLIDKQFINENSEISDILNDLNFSISYVKNRMYT